LAEAASAGKARSPSSRLANMPQRNVAAIVREKCQSVKLIKLIILIEIDYQHKMGVKGYLYSL
jgi:hypothetical protein